MLYYLSVLIQDNAGRLIMSSVSYTGSRYVPKVEGEYDSSRAYESLSVVLYNNASYTSRRTASYSLALN